GLRVVERRWVRTLVIYGVLLLGVGLLFVRLPSGFLPDEDQGLLFTQVVLPAGTPIEQTQRTMDAVRDHYLKDEKANIANVFTLAGFGFVGQGQNVGVAFVRLKPWADRPGKDNGVAAVVGRANAAFSKVRAGMVIAFAPPAVLELGNANGFDFELKDMGGLGHEQLLAARNQLFGMVMQDPRIVQLRPNGLEDTPQLKLHVDQAAAGAAGVSQAAINETVSTAFGGSYVNDFIDRGRVKKVFLQADAPFRKGTESLDTYFVRGSDGAMTPFSAFATTDWTYGPARLERYNGVPAMELMGSPAPGVSTGAAMKAIEEHAAKLPQGIGFEWTGLSYEEQLSGGQAPALYALSLLIVFLCLAALYESWSVPVAVLLVVPLGVLGAVLAANLAGLNNDIYLQVGLITTIGVSAKNAILIVEFAEEKMRGGMHAAEAALEAAKLRLRPILMTSFAFIFGVLPLAISSGAGAGGQNAIGWAVVGGMLSATALAIFFVPLFFFTVKRIFRQDQPRNEPDDERAATGDAGPQEAGA
ncbi:MAG: efflux RND transporter permease subunit, partial [Alphaproteobacteria bacterium]|nr:efflux RND transporter permease subunit [Alphaproteobacteria bacterium]